MALGDGMSGGSGLGPEPRPIRRGDCTGRALLTYIPRRRGPRHFQDGPSQALTLAKLLPTAGEHFAEDMGRLLTRIAPAGCTLVTCPPPSSRRSRRGWYFAAALAQVVAQQLGLPYMRVLRWTREGREDSKAIVYQRGKGRALDRDVRSDWGLGGERVLLIDDGWTTGITSWLCRNALLAAGAAEVQLRVLFRTELTRDRPAQERARLKRLARARRSQRHLPFPPTDAPGAPLGPRTKADKLDGAGR